MTERTEFQRNLHRHEDGGINSVIGHSHELEPFESPDRPFHVHPDPDDPDIALYLDIEVEGKHWTVGLREVPDGPAPGAIEVEVAEVDPLADLNAAIDEAFESWTFNF